MVKISVESRLLGKICIFENKYKNNEFMFKLGPKYFILSKIFRKSFFIF